MAEFLLDLAFVNECLCESLVPSIHAQLFLNDFVILLFKDGGPTVLDEVRDVDESTFELVVGMQNIHGDVLPVGEVNLCELLHLLKC